MENNITPKQLNENFIVQKSRPLLNAKDGKYSVNQLKLLDTYLACINSHTPDSDVITFSLREYAGLTDTERINQKDAEKCLSGLRNIEISIYDDNGTVTEIPLFSKRTLFAPNEQGEYIIQLKCNEEAKPYFFNIEDKTYVSYRLGNIILMKSKHSIHLYQYLKDNAFRIKWEVPLETVKETAFHMEPTIYQKNFSVFRNKILDKAVNEINHRTDIQVEYKTITVKGKVTAIEFTVTDRDKKKRPKAIEITAEKVSDKK